MTKRAYKYRFYPTEEQAHNFACTFGCCRFVYNWALKTRTTAYFQHGKKLYYHDLSHALTALKKAEGTAWLKDVSSVPLQQALRHLDTAFTNFFAGRANYPVYKKKHKEQSATYAASAFTWDGHHLTVAKQQEPLNVVWSRPLPMTDKVVGIDLGLKSFLVTSDGETLANPKYSARDEKKLAKAERRKARKKKGSKNRDKARRTIAKLHARIADTRRNFQHQVSTQIVRENQVICLETLAVKNMLKKHTLAKAIGEVGWAEFVRQLEYKAKWYGCTIVKIDRWYPSSKTCSACGHVLESLPLEVRTWVCPTCSVEHERDINAASNIVTAGLAALNACGGAVRREQVKASHASTDEAGSSH